MTLSQVNESKSVGMNWFTRRNDGLVWHNGSTATFTSYMGISPAEGFGVVVLCNQACKGQPKPTGASHRRRWLAVFVVFLSPTKKEVGVAVQTFSRGVTVCDETLIP